MPHFIFSNRLSTLGSYFPSRTHTGDIILYSGTTLSNILQPFYWCVMSLLETKQAHVLKFKLFLSKQQHKSKYCWSHKAGSLDIISQGHQQNIFSINLNYFQFMGIYLMYLNCQIYTIIYYRSLAWRYQSLIVD